MSYNQKPPGASGSGMGGGGPPNGPNNMPQVAKTYAGIQQQMQNLVHGQNAIPQTSQADINAFLQQQRIQSMLKHQQQFLQIQHQIQQQQHQQQHQQQQQHQHHNMAAGGGVVPGPVGGVPGVGGVAGPSSSATGGSGEPLALTRTAGAAELLNKTYQQQANGNPAANPTFNQIQQTLQALPTNFVQQLQVFQYQMQAKQMQQQQQHGGGQGQHGHGQQQPVHGVPPPPPTTTAMSHQQQQQQQQKHQNQHQQQQQQNALSRYLTAAAAQAAAVSGNKMGSATPPTPPPLTNQMKPPNLPPNTQITPVTGANVVGGNISAGPNPKMSTGNVNTGSAKHPAPPPSISLTPSKPATSGPSMAHQQNKFAAPTNSGAKGGHMGHPQNLPKSTHTATSNTTSPLKTGANADATVAALKSPQSTPVQLTKQMPPTATTAAMGSKSLASATTTTTVAPSTMVSPLKSSATTPTTALTPSATNTLTTSAAGVPNSTNITSTNTAPTNAAASKSPSGAEAPKPATNDLSITKLPTKLVNAEKEAPKPGSNDSNKPTADSSTAPSSTDASIKEAENRKEKKLETASVINKPDAPNLEVKDSAEKGSNDLKLNSASTCAPITVETLPINSKATEKKLETSAKSNKIENQDTTDNEKKLADVKKTEDKNKPTTDEKKTSTLGATSAKQPEQPLIDEKKPLVDLNPVKNSHDEKKIENKEKLLEKEKDKAIKSNKSPTKIVEELESVASKEAQTIETEADKPKTAVETKTGPTTTISSIPINPTEKNESNAKNSLEINNKKEKSESVQNKKEEKQPNIGTTESESSKAPIAGSTKESKKETCNKDNEESTKPNKSTEKAETVVVIKTTAPQVTIANKTISEDSVKNSTPIAQKEPETAAAAAPPKKLGRLAKGAKSKAAVTPATPVDAKASETQDDKPTVSSARVKRKLKTDNSHASASAPLTPKDDDDDADRKSKRHRLKTILYQSPLPELAFITKLSASEASNSPKPMSNEDRLIVFYKNEYMAVRNAEGTFYLCQTMQNVYRTSPRISIRWLSEDSKDNNIFIPDFYDHTDIECVLTTVDLKRIDKGHLRLPKGERSRIESILKKAIDVEKGLVPRPELTEENPDGLDISLFKDESQIEKKSALAEASESQTPSTSISRKSRKGTITAASSARKSTAAATTPSTSTGNKRKRAATLAASASSSPRKTSKKRKILIKRKKKVDNSDDDDEDETSDDYESDAEYKPTQKRASLTTSGASKSAPRAQRSPLAKARAASPITPTTSRSKNVPLKTTPTPSTSKASRGERAAKRKSIIDAGSSEEALMPVKKPTTTTTSNNKSKGTLKKTKH